MGQNQRRFSCNVERVFCVLPVKGQTPKPMPLYEYKCRKCHTRFELLRQMSDADRDVKCPKCRSTAVEREISGFAAGKCSSRSGFG